jgi:diguanylate cyclase (GGDEF)-like protein
MLFASRLPVRALAHPVGIAAVWLAAALALALRLDAGDPWWRAAALGAAFVAAGLVTITPRPRLTVNAQAAVVVAAVLLVPPELVALVALAQAFVLVGQREPWRRLVVGSAGTGLAALAADGLAGAVVRTPGLDGDGRLLAAGGAAVVAYAALSYVLVAGAALRRDALASNAAVAAFSTLGIACAGFWETNPWLLATLIAPVALGIREVRVPLLRRDAELDEKTGLFDARSFDDALRQELTRDRPFAVLMADLDHLRRINKTRGRVVGDEALRAVVRTLRAEVRSVDVPCSLGGEEFAVLLPGTDREAAAEVAERIRRAVSAVKLAPRMRVTLSIGVAAYPADGETAGDILEAADRALYTAKDTGRNRVVVAGEAPPAAAVVAVA